MSGPQMQGQDYVFTGTVPQRTGRHLIYAILQRSDSPEAFYSCSDVVFGADNGGSTSGGSSTGGAGTTGGSGTTGGAGASGGSGTTGGTGTTGGSGSGGSTGASTGGTPSTAPSKPGKPGKPGRPGRGRWDRIGTPDCPYAKTPTDRQIARGARMSSVEHAGHGDDGPRPNSASSTQGVRPQGGSSPLESENLAETGADSSTPLIALTGTAVLALGITSKIVIARRRAGRHGR